MAKDEKDINPDAPHLTADSPDDFRFFNSATLGSYTKAEMYKEERDRARALLQVVKEDYGITETDEEIEERMLDTLTHHVKNSFEDEEGFNALKRETAKHYGIGVEPKDPLGDSVDAFTAAQRRRMEADRKMFEPSDEENE